MTEKRTTVREHTRRIHDASSLRPLSGKKRGKAAVDPEDGTGVELRAVAPEAAEGIVRRDTPRGASDPQVRASEGVKIVGGGTPAPPSGTRKGVDIVSRESR